MWLNLGDERINEIIAVLNAGTARPDLGAELQAKLDDEAANKEVHAQYRSAAQERQEDGELEVDDDAVVSVGDDPGAYVMAWKWVPAENAGVKVEDTEQGSEHSSR